jgi:hypothetical protein
VRALPRTVTRPNLHQLFRVTFLNIRPRSFHLRPHDNTRGRPNSKRVQTWERGFAGCQAAFAVNPYPLVYPLPVPGMISQGSSTRDNLSDEQTLTRSRQVQNRDIQTVEPALPCSVHAPTSVFLPALCRTPEIRVSLPQARRDDEYARNRFNDNICREFRAARSLTGEERPLTVRGMSARVAMQHHSSEVTKETDQNDNWDRNS